MTLTTTPLSHDHAAACRDRPRLIELPAALTPGSKTMTALSACLDAWSGRITAGADSLHRDWSAVARLHRDVREQDDSTAAALWR